MHSTKLMKSILIIAKTCPLIHIFMKHADISVKRYKIKKVHTYILHLICKQGTRSPPT